MKNTIFLILLMLGLFACNDDDTNFVVSTEGLELKFTPVAGGAMMHYKLPNNSDVFAMNVRYTDSQGQKILKACGYSGDSLLLDGFAKAQDVYAQVSFVNHRNEESEMMDYQFRTLDSAPWTFFDDIEVRSFWNGFQVIYKTPSVVTGIAHIFYLGTNPMTQKEDTILVRSFPIIRGGDTLSFALQQEKEKNTVIIRTEDFRGYRVREEIYSGIDAFRTEQWTMTANDFKDFGLSQENKVAKTGVQYLFDGELKGRERLIASATEESKPNRKSTTTYATYLAGPNAYEKPIVLDMREQKTPAWIRMYCLYPLSNVTHPLSGQELGYIWDGSYEDKIPCKLTVYGSKESSDPNSGEWVYLGNLTQEPEATTVNDRWSYLTTSLSFAAKSVEDLAQKDPIYVDVSFPVLNETYRYLKIIVHDTFKRTDSEKNSNQQKYFTLHELEVYVKKN